MSVKLPFFVLALAITAMLVRCDRPTGIGLFESQSDIGSPKLAGKSAYAAEANRYTVSGGGANMWATKDAFHFLYKKAGHDLRLQARISWAAAGGHAHRKAGVMMRSALTPDAAYVDLVQHGDGLVAMQFRRQAGGSTEEIRGPQGVLGILCLERHGSLFSAHLIDSAGRFIPIGSLAIDLPDTLYAGLAVCSHDEDRLETAMLDSVMMQACPAKERIVESTLEILNIATGQRRIVHRAPLQFEAPNWFENKLVVNSKGRLFSIPAEGGEMQQINTGMADRCNNDHGFSKDGKWLAISHSPNQASLIYVLPAAGGSPRQVTMHGPSYWHGWSPDGRTLVYCAERQGEYDVYAIPFVGGAEKRLTTAIGLDDGPEYSPDGKYIYFNSVRTGVMKIWRMRPDGTHQEQVTFSEPFADWFAHPSPDGKWLAFISYDRAVPGHPANKNVCLRLMPASGGEPRIIAQFFGGQGSFNVPSWSADSRELAFVSYRLIGSAQP